MKIAMHSQCLSLALSVILAAIMTNCETKDSGKAVLPPPNAAAASATAGAARAAQEGNTPVNSEKLDETAGDQKAGASEKVPNGSSQVSPPPAQETSLENRMSINQDTSRLTGEIAADKRSQLSFRVGGFISEILVRPGTSCRKGDVLAKLDDRDYTIRMQLAKSRRELAEIALSAARKEWGREQQLKRENVSTDTSYDRIKVGFDQATVQLQVAKLEEQAAKQALDDTQLKAPYDCMVSAQLKHESENVQSGNGVMEVFAQGQPELVLSAPESMLGRIGVGTTVQVRIPSVGYQGEAKVNRLVSLINEKSRTFKVYAQISGSDKRIVPGLYAEATVGGSF